MLEQVDTVDPISEEKDPVPTSLALVEPALNSATTKRGADGKFVAGTTGNPRGRPISNKQKITDLHHALTLAVRSKVTAEQVVKVVEKTLVAAMGSGKDAVANRKLIFEYFVSKPKDADEVEDKGQSILIKIENATFKAQHNEPNIIDVEATEVSSNG